MTSVTLQAAGGSGPDDPPDWCFVMSPDGDLPTCTYANGQWHRSYEPGTGGGAEGLILLVLVLGLLAAVALTTWRVSVARRLAADAGMDVRDATAVTLLSGDGLPAAYLAANLGPRDPGPPPAPPARESEERLRQLRSLLDAGVITRAEHDERRRAIIDAL